MFKRKHPFGYRKRQQKRRFEEITQSQRGALDKFSIKEPQDLVENHENISHDENANENVENLGHAENDNVINEEPNHVGGLGDEEQPSQSIPLDIYDPRTWDGLDSKLRD